MPPNTKKYKATIFSMEIAASSKAFEFETRDALTRFLFGIVDTNYDQILIEKAGNNVQ